MFRPFARSIAAAACILSLIACAGSDPSSTSEDPASADSDVTAACGANYGKALALYKDAVAIAKAHKTDACGGVAGISDEGAYLTDIAKKAAAANATCGAFQNTIKTSPWAVAIREELADNLALSVLTGDLEIKDAKGAFTYKGLDTALVGKTLWGPAPGAYGNSSKLEFKADGKVTLSHQQWDDNADGPKWVSEEGTFRVGGVEGDSVMLTIEAPSGGTDYDFKATDWDGAPDFSLTPIEKETDTYTAYISECEA